MRFEISEVITQDQVMDLVYGNNSTPKRILGRHYLKNGQVIAAYHPDAVGVEVIKDDGEAFSMDMIERQPVFALYLPKRDPFHYVLRMTFRDGNTFVTEDPYSFPCQITRQEEERFLNGTWTDAYQKIGCHFTTIHGIDGMYFAVWAPTARRVSVVGDFNFWNGMNYPMNRLEASGIYELFLPGLTTDHNYKFEIKTAHGEVAQKPDPFGQMEEDGTGNASKILDIDAFGWEDSAWMKSRRYRHTKDLPMAVCSIGSGEELDTDAFFDGSFTHLLFSRYIEKGGVEHNGGCQKLLFQPSFCGGCANRFRSVINLAHKNGVSVLMEISLGYFDADSQGLEYFDGSALYGYSDRRLGFDSDRNKWRFCFRKPEVRSLVLSSLIFWIRRYHIDGFVFEGITDMILPKIDISNIFDGNIVKEAGELPHDNMHFLEQAVEVVHQEDISVILIADERPKARCSRGRLFSLHHGFDFYWDYSVRENINFYLHREMKERWKEHFRLTLPLQNQELESSLLLINPVTNPVKKRQEVLIDNFETVGYDKEMAELRMTAAFLLGIPGRKMWSWTGNKEEAKSYIRSLFEIYRKYPALYKNNTEDTSFEWINCVDAVSSVVSFMRRSAKKNNVLLFVSNFSDKTYENWQTGVHAYGRYHMILSSDGSRYGGSGCFDAQDVISMRSRCDFRPYSIQISLPPRTTLIFEYISM